MGEVAVEVGGEMARRRDHDGGQGVAGGRNVGNGRGGGGRVGRTRERAVGRSEESDLPDLGVADGAGNAAGIHLGVVGG